MQCFKKNTLKTHIKIDCFKKWEVFSEKIVEIILQFCLKKQRHERT